MAISVAQSGQAGAAGGTWAVTLGGGTTVGNTLFYVAFGFNTANTAMSSSAPTLGGNPVAGAAKIASAANTFTTRVLADTWMLPNIPAGQTACAITVTGSQSINNVGLVVFEVAGLGASPSVDQGTPTPNPPTVGNSGSGSTPNAAINSGATGAITSTPQFVIGAGVNDIGAAAIAAGFTGLATGGDVNSWAGYQIPVSAGGTYTWAQTSTSASDWASTVVTVKVTVAAPVIAGGLSQVKKSLLWADL